MFPAPGTSRLQFQIKNVVVPLGELQGFFERWNALANEGTAKPGAGIQAAKLGKGQVVHTSLPVGGAIDGVVVNRDETRIAGKLKVGFDEAQTHRDSLAERGEGVFGSVAGSAPVRDQEQRKNLLAQTK